MELYLATAIGLLTAVGTYLLLRGRSFPVILGLTLISYAVNLFIFASGGLRLSAPPILQSGVTTYTDPVPQALVLTAIVISFAMTAVITILALGAWLGAGHDRVDMSEGDEP
ncbi:Na+/H+ antiporter subunit C [Neogemmobacter tilapiae]|uniref:Na+/H+ antiporter subunit C n=1 Tax=Neogemmobacter tilapiae TaxID=875041 RepID=A0A918WFV0_9RHOB|nr:Na+/H+ antiporter subunit C [Gemmobacter tilapiae]GHC47500.1 Na+/H+ antiporter subunit C [Gemmobacter tilapiae]